MRIAAVAFVLIVGAAVVLAFANTLNSWVVGGLLGGLAAILLSIPISLALFTLLARRQEARQHSHSTDESYDEEGDFADDYDGRMIYSAEGYLVPEDDDDYESELRARASLEARRMATPHYLALPPARQSMTSYDDEEGSETLPRHDLRNYPRQPRQSVRPVEPEYGTLAQQNQQRSADGSRRDLSTRSLAQHQSAAIRQASQEAQRQATNRRSGSSTRREQENRSRALQRPRTSHDLRPPAPSSVSKRPLDEYETRLTRSQNIRPNWNEEDVDEGFSARRTSTQEQYQQYPRSASYPRNPRAPRPGGPQNSYSEDDYQQNQPQPQPRRPRRDPDPDRLSGNLRDPLVRRAPYLYDDDPMRAQLARQLDPDRPITKRSSLHERYEDDEY